MSDENPNKKKLTEFLSRNSGYRPRLTIVEKSLKLADSKLSETLSEKSHARKTPIKSGYSPDTSIISVTSHKSDHPNNSTTTSNNSNLLGELDSDAEDPNLSAEHRNRAISHSVIFASNPSDKTGTNSLSQSMKLYPSQLKHTSEYKKSAFSDQASSSDEKHPHRENSEGSVKKYTHGRHGVDRFMPISEESNTLSSSPNINKISDLGLDASIFPADLVYFSEENRPNYSNRQYIKEVIKYAHQIKDHNPGGFYDKRPASECFYNIYFKGESLIAMTELMQKVSDLLKKSVIGSIKDPRLTGMYNSAIEAIEVHLDKLKKANNTPVKFTEKDLRRIYDKLMATDEESCLESKSCAYCNMLVFLRTTIKKFPSIFNSCPLNENVIVEFISLPKLLENFVNPGTAAYFKTTVIYTYDLYISAINLLFYLIMRYFAPRPIVMSNSEYLSYHYSHTESKVYILNILTTWIGLRKFDFVRTPNIATILNEFLEFIEPKEKDPDVRQLIRHLCFEYIDITAQIVNKNNIDYETPRLKELPKTKLTQKAEHMRNSTQGSRFLSSFQFPTGYELMNKEGICYQAILEESAELIAIQLTLIDWKIFLKIDISELITKRWTAKDKSDCPYYWKYAKRFNSFSYWIQFLILNQEELGKREDLAKTFLKIASICIKNFNNYCSAHYIFTALLTLKKLKTIRFESEEDQDAFRALELLYTSDHISTLYEETYRKLDLPAIPDIRIFLTIFLKMQDGVEFMVRLPDSKQRMLKFPLIVQIKEYCDELKRFQRSNFKDLTEDDRVYNFLKEDYKKGFSVNFDNPMEITDTLRKLVEKIKERHEKMMSFFNVNPNNANGLSHSGTDSGKE